MNSTHPVEVVWTGVAVSCAVTDAVLHALLVPVHLEEAFYIGLLFAVGSVVMLVVAVALVVQRRPVAAWLTGVPASLGMVVGFAMSRTVGLPGGYYEDGWEAPYGPLSLLAEGLFVVAFLAWFSYDTAEMPQPHPTARLITRQ
ncbi:hypothetical protein ACFZCP_35435 [Streptomyces sp. NPDC007971]|uniref:hypothetical protein n=1 Tax=Streptomyces sp. NPDC007971 TaxID=3364799 RepID=UPI0036E4A538